MKKSILLPLALLVISCGMSTEEQMLFDYQQKKVKAMNFDLNDLDFKIQKIEKLSDITVADSMKHLKLEFATYWRKNPEQSLVDTLTFEYVKDVLTEAIAKLDTLQGLYQEATLTAIRSNRYASRMEYERKRDEAIDDMFDNKKLLSAVEEIEGRYNELSKNPDSILSVKYQATYSLKNPVLGNAKQTFDKIFYTNSSQTAFVKDEEVE